jgi:hypothetical protein
MPKHNGNMTKIIYLQYNNINNNNNNTLNQVSSSTIVSLRFLCAFLVENYRSAWQDAQRLSKTKPLTCRSE